MCSCRGEGSLPREGGSSGSVEQARDSLYTEKAAMDVYSTQPERALVIIDSALIVGNLTDNRADLLRAMVYSHAYESTRQDTAIVICERLLQSDIAIDSRQMALEILTYSARLLQDYELLLQYDTELADVCRQQDYETEALRTDAEIGFTLVQLGKAEEGLSLIDSVLSILDNERKFNELDASIIATKRKVSALEEENRQAGIIPAVERILDRLADYEQHPADYHDGTYREPSDEDRPSYIAFYRSQSYAFLATAYAALNEKQKARDYLALFDQTDLGNTLDGRRLVASAQCKLGEYDKMESTYRELETIFRQRGDTITGFYAYLLRDRAIAAHAQNRYDESIALWQRHAEVLQAADERLLRGKATLFAARYHAQEQQHQIEKGRAKAQRNRILALAGASLSLFALILAWYAVRQRRIVDQKNRSLVRQIAEAAKLSEELKVKNEQLKEEEKVPASNIQLDALPSDELFQHIRQVIMDEKLYLNPAFDRQAAIDYFHISKARVGEAFAQGSEHAKITDFINLLRLEHARDLITAHPEMSIDEVSTASGFSVRRTFSRLFKEKYDLTPTEYRNLYRFEIESNS